MASMIRAVMALVAILILAACGSMPQQKDRYVSTTVETQPVAQVAQPVAAPLQSTRLPLATASQQPASWAVTRTERVTPEQLSSFQPFARFAKGDGEGYAREYRARTKAQVVALLRNPGLAKKEMRVSCEVLVRQMAEAHGLPFEGCVGAAAEIERNGDYQVAECSSQMFRTNSLAVTNRDGTQFGVWHRDCLAGEKVLTYKGRPILSTTCLNPVIPRERQVTETVQVPPTPVATTTACPSPQLALNIWGNGAINAIPELQATIAGTRKVSNSWYEPDRVSRQFGAQLRQYGVRGAGVHEVVINHLKGATAVQLYRGSVTGQYLFPIPAGFAPGDAIQVVFIDLNRVVSPVSDLRAAYSEIALNGCGRTTHIHAIER